jgi:hypothetical protein
MKVDNINFSQNLLILERLDSTFLKLREAGKCGQKISAVQQFLNSHLLALTNAINNHTDQLN